jgi:hypothetical protein
MMLDLNIGDVEECTERANDADNGEWENERVFAPDSFRGLFEAESGALDVGEGADLEGCRGMVKW